MKKTINITLAGLLFTVEEDAYEKLKKYLDDVKAHFSTYPEHEDIIQDMEARISEHFGQKPKNVGGVIITLTDVDELIAAMGKVEDFQREEEAPRRGTPEQPDRKLYRNPDDAIIAGVCSGLAAYFQIDTVIVRLIFGLTLFFGGFGVLLYIILWVIMPEAKTPLDKARMRGAPVTLSGIQQTVRERVEEFRTRNGDTIKKATTAPKNILARLFAVVGMIVQKLFKVFGKFIGVLLVIGAALALFGLTFALVMVLFNGNSPYVDFPLTGVLTGWPYHLLLASAFLTAFVPLLFLLMLGSNIVSGKSGIGRATGFSLLGLWVLALLSCGVVLGKYGPEIQAKIEQNPAYHQAEQRYDVRDFTGIDASNAVRVHLSRGTEFQVTARGRQADLERLDISVDDGRLRIRERQEKYICIFCDQSAVEIAIVMPELNSLRASGAVRVEGEAMTRAQNFDLNVNGASRINLTLSPLDLQAKISGASRVELRALPELSRTSGKLTLDMSGASRLETGESHFQNAQVEISGASRAYINAFSRIDGSLSGASKLYYYGDPRVNVQTSGASSIQKQAYPSDTETDGMDFENSEPAEPNGPEEMEAIPAPTSRRSVPVY